MNKMMLMLALSLGMAGLASEAEAGGYGQGYIGLPYTWAGGHYNYRLNTTNGRPPYFAEFPPVYYSYPVARTYGLYSYPYMPACSDVQPVRHAEPATITNPYCDVAESAPLQAKVSGPQVVLNPFVKQNGAEEAPRLAERAATPQVIYPASEAR